MTPINGTATVREGRPAAAAARTLVYAALDELNAQLEPASRVPRQDDAALVGATGHLDSLGVVTLVALLEERLELDFSLAVNLLESDEEGDLSHFADVGALIEHVESLLGEHADA